MGDLTTERWQDLNAKLEAEIAALSAALVVLNAKSTRAAWVFLAALSIPFMVAGVAWFFIPAQAASAGALCVPAPIVAAFFWIRAARAAGVQRAEVERVSHDHRQWKRRKPGGPPGRTGAQAGPG